MIQPAISSVSSDVVPFVAERTGPLPALHRAEGPANRLLSELTLALSADGVDAGKWSASASLRFIFATCGGFWLVAAGLFYTFH